jgi:hypothetical protein
MPTGRMARVVDFLGRLEKFLGGGDLLGKARARWLRLLSE